MTNDFNKNIDNINDLNDKKFGFKIKPRYITISDNGRLREVIDEIEINWNGQNFIIFVDNYDKIRIKHFSLAQNPKRKDSYHTEKVSFNNIFKAFKWINTSHRFSPK